MKTGTGDLDFGESSGDDEDDGEQKNDVEEFLEADFTSGSSSQESADDSAAQEHREQQKRAASTEASSRQSSNEEKYPYFVRQSKVGDERTERLEIHVRPFVKSDESDFLNELANKLQTDEVSKTDAREYALIVAQENTDLIAARMRDDGYGELD